MRFVELNTKQIADVTDQTIPIIRPTPVDPQTEVSDHLGRAALADQTVESAITEQYLMRSQAGQGWKDRYRNGTGQLGYGHAFCGLDIDTQRSAID